MTQRKRWLDVTIIGIASFGMLIAGAAGLYSKNQGDKRSAAEDAQRLADATLITCLNKFANDMADALDARTEASAPRDKAEAKVFRVVYDQYKTGKASRAEFEKALAAYVAADDNLTRERAKNPIPDPPREVCPRG
jgi:hypothetical protein